MEKYNMTFEEAQEFISKRGFDIPWNDCDVFVDERHITQTVANVIKWAEDTIIEKSCNWLDKNAAKYLVTDYIHGIKMTCIDSSLSEDFRKVMLLIE